MIALASAAILAISIFGGTASYASSRGATIAQSSSVACATYLVIDSRGSGEPGGKFSKPGGAFYHSLVKELGRLGQPGPVWRNYNSYPAAAALGNFNPLSVGKTLNGLGAFLHRGDIGAYRASVRKGQAILKSLIQGQAASACSSTKIVLVGYSQGAQVTANVLQGLSKDLRQQIAAVVLFADPRFNGSDVRVSRGIRKTRFNGVLGKRKPFQSGGPLVLSYCKGDAPADPVCHYTSFRALVAHHSQHGSYWRGLRGAPLLGHAGRCRSRGLPRLGRQGTAGVVRGLRARVQGLRRSPAHVDFKRRRRLREPVPCQVVLLGRACRYGYGWKPNLQALRRILPRLGRGPATSDVAWLVPWRARCLQGAPRAVASLAPWSIGTLAQLGRRSVTLRGRLNAPSDSTGRRRSLRIYGP